MKLREAIAELFIDEGTTHLFALMGDGNMDWVLDTAEKGVEVIHARHEHAAVAMADGYARAKTAERAVGISSVTHGPGLTQLGTALAVAARNRTPMVVFVGDTAIDAAFHPQDFDPDAFVTSTGAGLIEVSTVGQALLAVRRAFNQARLGPGPVVLSVPVDLQETEVADDAVTRAPPRLTPELSPVPPHPDALADVADTLHGARRPIILAGRGAVHAREALIALANRTGALLATSLEALGLFDGHPAELGLAGGYTRRDFRELFASADLVIGFGARMGRFTTDGDRLFGDARRVQVDLDPVGYVEGLRVADHYLRADARLAAEALDAELATRGVVSREGLRTEEVMAALARGPRDDAEVHAPDLEPSTLDPRDVAAEINAHIGDDALVVLACGHFWNFVISALSGRGNDAYVMAYDFAAIGQGLATAIGAAVARPERRVILLEGDGGFIMHSQELDTVARHDVPLLCLIFDDGAYGAELHKLSAYRGDGAGAVFGRAALDRVAEAWGVEGVTVRELDGIAPPMKRFDADGTALVVDIHTSATVISESYRRLHHGE